MSQIPIDWLMKKEGVVLGLALLLTGFLAPAWETFKPG
jgi:hypothetical protein